MSQTDSDSELFEALFQNKKTTNEGTMSLDKINVDMKGGLESWCSLQIVVEIL